MMTDLDFYKKALYLQSWVLAGLAQIKAYSDYWNEEICKEKAKEYFDIWAEDEDVKEVFCLENLTKERALAIGFRYWNKEQQPDFLLFPLWYVFLLPYGTKVTDIFGRETAFTEETDLDNRMGCVAFGINIEK